MKSKIQNQNIWQNNSKTPSNLVGKDEGDSQEIES